MSRLLHYMCQYFLHISYQESSFILKYQKKFSYFLTAQHGKKLYMARNIAVTLYQILALLLLPRNFSRGRGVIPSLAERGSSLVSVNTTSLECSVLKCGQATQRTIHLTTLLRRCIPNWKYSRWQDCSPRSARDGMTPLPWLKLRGPNS
jgi:hypothetical protein